MRMRITIISSSLQCWCALVHYRFMYTIYIMHSLIIIYIDTEHDNDACLFQLQGKNILWMSNLFSLEVYCMQIQNINYTLLQSLWTDLIIHKCFWTLNHGHLRNEVPKILSISQCNFKSILENWKIQTYDTEQGPKLFQLEITKCNVASIPDELFLNFKVQLELVLSHNNIKLITERTFTGLRTIRTLDLAYNSIKHVHQNAFKDLKNLNILVLRNNNIFNWKPIFFSTWMVTFPL